jgi:hypothetical protein
MLTDLITELATVDVPEIFNENGTAFCNIVRATETQNGYGGVTAVDADILADIPCDYRAASDAATNARYQLGIESSLGFISMPKVFEGDVIELLMTDKIVIQADELITHDRTFQIRDINPNRGAYYRVTVVEENKTNG